MERISAALMTKALDCLNQRYLFTAQNIANANTQDYQPVHVEFEDALRQAATRGTENVRRVEARAVVAPSSDGAMRLDLELASASQTALRYRALLEVLSQRAGLDRTVVSGGR